MPIAIIVHGGAGSILTERKEIAEAGCREAAQVGWRILEAGGSALDAVEAAVRSLEDNPEYNAGTGACLTVDGRIELDAGIMDGSHLQVGAIASVECIKNPISVARHVMDSPHVLLVGAGAQQFAQEQGIEQCSADELMTEHQYRKWEDLRAQEGPTFHRREVGSVKERVEEEKHGTVGAVALDKLGKLAAATSTGGIPNKYPGRVGDSPLVGCGFYADETAAISCTGHGEDFTRLLLAKRAADFVAAGDTAQEAADRAITVLGTRALGTGGLIIVDDRGHIGFAHNSEHMAYGYMSEEISTKEPVAGI